MRPNRVRHLCLSLLLCPIGWMFIAGVTSAEQDGVTERSDVPPEQIEFFESRIRPVLIQHCYECHSADSKILRGGLLVDSKAGLLEGGDSGSAIMPGDPGNSLLMEALRFETYEMPPTGKLPKTVIDDFEAWVAMGAPDPRDQPTEVAHSTGMSVEEGRQFWSFQPIREQAVPEISSDKWPRTSIDRFIQDRQVGQNVHPGADADRLTLLRRLKFDLLGLPPTPEEIDSFLNDQSSDAIATVVDLMLDSPQFGERWGRHWLDVARYADSTGGGRSLLYEKSWKYRDYVIDAFNSDKPFDEFVVEQIAGDLLPYEDHKEGAEQLIATAFLALGPHNYENQDKEQLRMDVIDEQIDTIGRAFMGLTIGCARCHDHKFDPIPQRDYYALAGIFRSTNSLVDGNVSKWVSAAIPPSPKLKSKRQEHELAVNSLEKQIRTQSRLVREIESEIPKIEIDDRHAEFTGEWTESTSVKGFVGSGYRHSSDTDATALWLGRVEQGKYTVQLAYTPAPNRTQKAKVTVYDKERLLELEIDQTKRPTIDQQYIELGTIETEGKFYVHLQPTENRPTIADGIRLIRVADDEDRFAEIREKLKSATDQLLTLRKELDDLKENAPPESETVIAVEEQETPADYHLCIRGDHKHLGDIVPRGFLSVVENEENSSITDQQSGRLELAHWIASRDNPLTARVTVNRVWSHLFGTGLVRTVDNFGVPGEQPSHPELLDHLAWEFMEDGWSIKRLIRRVVLSRTYQLASRPTEAAGVDPENRLLTRQNRRRLDAECLHDAMLQVSGELNGDIGGNTMRPGTKSEYGYSFEFGRRAVYLPVFRNQLAGVMAAFDFADPNLSIGKRTPTTLSTQGLLMLNSPFVDDRVKQTAERTLREHSDDQARLEWLAQSCFGRPLRSDEQRVFERFLTNSDIDRQDQWEMITRAMFGSFGFRYLD